MPMLKYFDASNNQITSINISSLSQNSENVLAKLGHIIEKYNNTNYFISAIKQNKNFFYSFSNNLMSNVFFNLETLYPAIMDVLDIRDILLLKFSSIVLKNNEKLNCDCNLFNDIDFIINGPFTESPFYSNLFNTFISLTQCLQNTTKSFLFYDIYNEVKNSSYFCINSDSTAIIPTTIQTIPKTSPYFTSQQTTHNFETSVFSESTSIYVDKNTEPKISPIELETTLASVDSTTIKETEIKFDSSTTSPTELFTTRTETFNTESRAAPETNSFTSFFLTNQTESTSINEDSTQTTPTKELELADSTKSIDQTEQTTENLNMNTALQTKLNYETTIENVEPQTSSVLLDSTIFYETKLTDKTEFLTTNFEKLTTELNMDTSTKSMMSSESTTLKRTTKEDSSETTPENKEIEKDLNSILFSIWERFLNASFIQ
jgi:hypothetical protein